MLDPVDGHRPAMTNVDHPVRPGHGDDRRLVEPNRETTATLDRCGSLVVAHQAVRHAVRGAVRCTTTTDAEVRPSETSKILE